MAKFKRYRVAHMFTHEGVVITNDHEEAIRAMPTEVRAHHVALGNLEEFEADEAPPVPLAEANARSTPAKKKE
jgi:hypothetical protein